MPKRALIAMSGGVDSSVAAHLAGQMGYETIGVTLKLFDGTGAQTEHSTCCSLEDVEDARSVSFALDMPHYVFDFGERFQEEVIDRFVSSYASGQTPNPCIDCNRYIKFEALLRRAEEIGFDFVVTGHYARVSYCGDTGRYLLRKGVDPTKDQSYMLYAMTQRQLAKTLFPLGALTKQQVRTIAKELSFVNQDKPDSQDICFVPDGDYRTFLQGQGNLCVAPGDFIDIAGNRLGTHKGTFCYTVGQRKGLGVSAAHPLYVLSIDVTHNTVTLGPYEELLSSSLIASNLNFIAIESLSAPMQVEAKIRYKHAPAKAIISPLPDGLVKVEFVKPQPAITAGQAVVFYHGELVIGGGTIAGK